MLQAVIGSRGVVRERAASTTAAAGSDKGQRVFQGGWLAYAAVYLMLFGQKV